MKKAEDKDLWTAPGRPLGTENPQHSYSEDYNPSLYQNLDASTFSKVRVSSPVRLLDDQLEWHHFRVPLPDPHKLNVLEESDSVLIGSEHKLHYTNDIIERRKKWMSRWMNETGGKLANGTDPFENDSELEMIRRRVQDLVHTFPLNFTSMLYDIRYKREQLKLRRKQIGDAKTKLDAEKKVKKKKRNKNHKGVSWLLLDSQSASSVLFYLSCFHVVGLSFAGLLQEYNEAQELSMFGPVTPVTSRKLGIIGLWLMLCGSLIGLLGLFFKKRVLILLYIVTFIVGVGLYLIEAWLEYHYAFGDEIKGYLKGELKDYFKSIHRKGKFLMKAQAKLHCCGINGWGDYSRMASSSTGIQSLPQSCCTLKGARCELKLGSPLPHFVHDQGCATPMKRFLKLLHTTKVMVLPFIVFSVISSLFTLILLYNHRASFYSDSYNSGNNSKDKKKCRRDQLKDEYLISCKDNLAQNLLDDVLLVTSTGSRDQVHGEAGGKEMEDISGTIDNVRKRLASCETITEFIPVMVQILHEFDAFRDHGDPEAVARVILGIRPKRFPSEKLVNDEFEGMLLNADKDEKVRASLGQRDLFIRMDMEQMTDSVRETLTKKLEHLQTDCSVMEFPLPRPLVGVRHSLWARWHDQVVREDKYLLRNKEKLDPLDPEYLEQDRVLELVVPEDEDKPRIWKRWWAKLFPKWFEMKEDKYMFLEDGLYGPAVQVLSNIISEGQGILRDMHRKTRFRKVEVSSDGNLTESPSVKTLLPVSASVSRAFPMTELDMEKVDEVLSKLVGLEVIREQMLNHWIMEQQANEDERKGTHIVR